MYAPKILKHNASCHGCHNNLKADFTHYYGLGQRSADLYEVSSKAGSKTSKTTPTTEVLKVEEETIYHI